VCGQFISVASVSCRLRCLILMADIIIKVPIVRQLYGQETEGQGVGLIFGSLILLMSNGCRLVLDHLCGK
jgi:hypothetical protein